MVDPLETFFVSWSQNRKQPLAHLKIIHWR
jgi:hypothetical protein